LYRRRYGRIFKLKKSISSESTKIDGIDQKPFAYKDEVFAKLGIKSK